jgi:hypothetical protein
VLPCLAGYNLRDRHLLYAERSSNLPLRLSLGTTPANLANLVGIKLRSWTSLAVGDTAFADRIGTVVGLGSEKQVVGINTRRVVTLVADVQPVRDATKVQLERDAVSTHLVFAITLQSKHSVPVLIPGSRPQPAGRGLLDLRPETLFQWLLASRIASTACRAKTRIAVAKPIRIDAKLPAAFLTGQASAGFALQKAVPAKEASRNCRVAAAGWADSLLALAAIALRCFLAVISQMLGALLISRFRWLSTVRAKSFQAPTFECIHNNLFCKQPANSFGVRA